mgnify:CR=1 FL=1
MKKLLSIFFVSLFLLCNSQKVFAIENPKDISNKLEELQNVLNDLQEQLEIVKDNARKESKAESLLNYLIRCESRGNPKAINHADTKINGFPSKGILQFSPVTFLKMGKLHGFFPENFTLKDAQIIIWNPELQKAIAKKMLEEKGGAYHWKNCYLSYLNRAKKV